MWIRPLASCVSAGCSYASNQAGPLSHHFSCLWIVAPGLGENPFEELWIRKLISSDTLQDLAIVCINPHWEGPHSTDPLNQTHYQSQLADLLSRWILSSPALDSRPKSIGLLGFSQGGGQIFRFLLTHHLAHSLLHQPSQHSFPLLAGVILVDPCPPEEDEAIKWKCPFASPSLSSSLGACGCLRQAFLSSDKVCRIFSVDGCVLRPSFDVQRLEIGMMTAELLGLENDSRVTITVPGVRHNDLPLQILDQLLSLIRSVSLPPSLHTPPSRLSTVNSEEEDEDEDLYFLPTRKNHHVQKPSRQSPPGSLIRFVLTRQGRRRSSSSP